VTPRRRRIGDAALALGLALVIAASLLWWRRASGPPRIVLVVVDTLRSDHLSVYGGSVPTPHVDALAARGQVFENVVASFHQTSMSMAALFTGRTPSIESGTPAEPLAWNGSTWCGMARFAAPGELSCIPDSLPTLAEGLRSAGYWTIGVASNQFLYEPAGFARGFDDWVQVDERRPVAGPRSRDRLRDPRASRTWRHVNRAAAAALERRAHDRFLLYVHYIDVHDYRFQQQTYAEAVAVMDRALGELLADLGARGLLDGTVVVFTSDHGEKLGEYHGLPDEFPNSFGHYGNPSFQEMLHIPLIVAPPVFEDTSRFLRTQDLYGLVQQIAGIAPPPARDTAAEELFVGELKYRTYRKGRWKSAVRRADGRAFLFDLEADPDEQTDLSERNPLVLLSHRNRINALTRELAARAQKAELSEEDRERLRVLGYLEPE
jgi:arylsulfatase A-like enzyme